MGAFVEHDFGDGFILDEERIRKIHNLIIQRIASFGVDYTIDHKIYRGDSYCYNSNNIEDIINEENEDWRKLTRIKFICIELGLILDFDKHGVKLKIEADDRDKVFILFSDLRSYIDDEVILKRKILSLISTSNLSFVIIFFVMSFLMFSIFSYNINSQIAISPEQALKSDELVVKLNYLVNQSISNYSLTKSYDSGLSPIIALFGFMMLTIVLQTTRVLEKAKSYFFPKNIFLLGKQKSIYEHRKKITERFIWGIVIAFAVSVVAGLFSKFLQ